MNFEETEEQNMIRNMVRSFAEEVLQPTTLTRDKNQQAPIEEWSSFCETSLQGITIGEDYGCLLYTSPSPRDRQKSRMPSSA